MQSIEKKQIGYPENYKKQALISSLTYWKNDLKNVVNRNNSLKNNLLGEVTAY